MSAPPVPTSMIEIGLSSRCFGATLSSRSIARRLNRTPPSTRLIRRRSRRLPASVAGSSSGPSRSSATLVSRSIAGEATPPTRRWAGRGLLPSVRMAHPIARRRLALAIVGLIMLVAGTGPALAAVSSFYPTQSLGDRGTDVWTIQQLIHAQQPAQPPPSGGRSVIVRGINPVVVPIDGIFGPTTLAGVRIFQASRGLPETGVVDAATWGALVVPLAQGATGDAVVALQRLLREKRSAAVPTDGTYGSATTAAVRAFQAHMGLAQRGSVDGATWRALLWHYEVPRFSAAALCDYDRLNGPANWGTAETISTLEAAGAAMVSAGFGRVRSATCRSSTAETSGVTSRTRSDSMPTCGRCARRMTNARGGPSGTWRPTIGRQPARWSRRSAPRRRATSS